MSASSGTMLKRAARSAAAPRARGSHCCRAWPSAGVCGKNMTVRYRTSKGQQNPYYLCDRERIEAASAECCQSLSGGAIDRAVGELLVELMTPLTLDVALQVQDELAARAEEADLWRAQRVQRAREEADLARQRFIQTPSRQPDGGRRAGGGVEREASGARGGHNASSSAAAPSRARSWTKSNAGESSRWPATSPVCGTIRRRRNASASEWRGF